MYARRKMYKLGLFKNKNRMHLTKRIALHSWRTSYNILHKITINFRCVDSVRQNARVVIRCEQWLVELIPVSLAQPAPLKPDRRTFVNAEAYASMTPMQTRPVSIIIKLSTVGRPHTFARRIFGWYVIYLANTGEKIYKFWWRPHDLSFCRLE